MFCKKRAVVAAAVAAPLITESKLILNEDKGESLLHVSPYKPVPDAATLKCQKVFNQKIADIEAKSGGRVSRSFIRTVSKKAEEEIKNQFSITTPNSQAGRDLVDAVVAYKQCWEKAHPNCQITGAADVAGLFSCVAALAIDVPLGVFYCISGGVTNVVTTVKYQCDEFLGWDYTGEI